MSDQEQAINFSNSNDSRESVEFSESDQEKCSLIDQELTDREFSEDVGVDQTEPAENLGQANDDEIGFIPCSLGAKLSALLFVSARPLSVEALAEAANVRVETVERELPKIQERFIEDLHGISLVEIAGGWQFRTNPGAATSIQRLIPKSARKLSRAAAETLAVIAYRQPVQRAEIETIRGVDALPTLKTLLDARLIRIVGRSDAAGTPALYGTTPVFLEKFGLSDLSQLPSPRELAELMKDPGESSAGENLEIEDQVEVRDLEQRAEQNETQESKSEELGEKDDLQTLN